MKKKSKETKNRRPRVSEEDRALNRQLGNFGLEPPKIYRSSERSPSFSDDSEFGDLPSFSRREEERRERRPREAQGRSSERRRAPAERKKKNTRKMSKLRRNIIFYSALTIAITAIVVVLSLTVLFKIHTVNVTGNVVYSAKEVLTVLPIQQEENLFLINKEKAAEKLEENLPYIYSVEIKRKLPSTVVVRITETPQVYYVVNEDKSYAYLDDNFKVLEPHGSAIPEGSIEIKKAKLKLSVVGKTAEFTNGKITDNLKKLAKSVDALALDKITAIYSEDINNNYIIYDKRITFKLGTTDNLEKKIYSALTATEKLNETNPNAKGEMTATDDKQIYFTEKR